MTDRFCPAGAGRQVCYRTDGDPSGSPLVLIAGLTLDLTSWPREMIDGLVAQGFYVIRFDNRDVGRTTPATTPPPSLWRRALQRPRQDGYDLADMAGDAVAVLDHLGVERAHVVGMSMGGMIAQTIAARYPTRTLSLTSIFSTTGSRRVGQAAMSTQLLLANPGSRTRKEFIRKHLRLVEHLAGKGFAPDMSAAAEYATRAWDRGLRQAAGAGVARQINAVYKSGDRTAELRRVTAPTLVIHGDRDPIVHPSGGRATAAAISGARLVTIAGMGHDLSPGVIDRLVALIAQVSQCTSESRGDVGSTV
ncbi:alpha/beta hydrolase [Mycobacterium intermedium]|uniref:Alpha/beta hydrolase n=1 Tax=Mycobacterium intermedium TaxID=28445 RepID=A0A1E3SI98_MYCIE|nr:alpha/beta fold hydrolase [Mycobacterium intermedium]MCV6964566.1 alpha/beta fold hydrolase [Mycobacterium intermedium]ODR01373.1 alpha/beta hydrolase [Mycobacterium intermedium]OPE52529.1 alpha/beta hydrolase [Mycobacterium intermedium]ORB07483.1 alpha/beta hydrolase [Mycobacterium intermedium]